jgi:hypothetical protein
MLFPISLTFYPIFLAQTPTVFSLYTFAKLNELSKVAQSPLEPVEICMGARQLTMPMTKIDFWTLDVHTKYIVKATDHALKAKEIMYVIHGKAKRELQWPKS